MKKRILLFVDSMKNHGGIERVISNLLDAWSKKYEVTLLVKDDFNNSFYYIPKYIHKCSINEPLKLDMTSRRKRIIAFSKNIIKCHRKLKSFLRDNEFDYIYTTSPFNSLEVVLMGKKYRNMLVVSEHASAFAVNNVYKVIKRVIYPKVKCISVPNTRDVEVYKKWGCDVRYIPHLITLKGEDKNLIQDSSKVVLNIGRYTPDKRQKLLIETWAQIKEKKGWKLWIVGSGEEKSSLQDAIKEYDLEESVKLVAATKDVKSIYRQAALFVFTSRMEGFGMVLLEAMAYGIPCVSFDCPSGPRDIIKNGVNGFLVRNDDKNNLRERIEQLINNRQLLEELSIGAYNTVNNWDNEKIINSWDCIFDN